MIDRIESAINYVSDLNWIWWPVLRFRPGKQELFSSQLVFAFALSVAVAANGIVVLLRLAFSQPVSLQAVVVVFLAILVSVFAWFWIVAHFWNRRALRLQKEST